ncbi:MAG: homoserine kinase [Terriglobales bacterium]
MIRAKRPSSPASSFKIVLPGTSANLGPAFDAAALALKLFLQVSAKASGTYSILATGSDAEICGRVENHLILTTYRDVLLAERKSVQPLSLRIKNEIPIGKGCGSSAAARLAGIALAAHFGKLRWSDNRIIGEAASREHHSDNAAACWFGGLVAARMANTREAQTVRIKPKGKWPLLLAIPDESLATEKARQVLPAQYSRADTVTNIQNSMILLAAFVQGRPDLISAALEDRMHQPYRASLCPLLPALHEMQTKSGILGVALSGAGPSVLIFINPKASIAQVKARVLRHLRAAGLSAEVVSTTITERGGSSSFRLGRRQ